MHRHVATLLTGAIETDSDWHWLVNGEVGFISQCIARTMATLFSNTFSLASNVVRTILNSFLWKVLTCIASIPSFSCRYSSSTLPLHRFVSSFDHVNRILNLKAKPLSFCFSLMASNDDIVLQEDRHFTSITNSSPSMVAILSGLAANWPFCVSTNSPHSRLQRDHCRSIHIFHHCVVLVFYAIRYMASAQWSVIVGAADKIDRNMGDGLPFPQYRFVLLAVRRPHRSTSRFDAGQLLLVQ